MKKIIIIIIINSIFINSFNQRVYTPEQYLKQAYINNIISITLSPHKLGIGLAYTSKPVIELDKPICFFSSFEFGQYDEGDQTTLKLFKLNLGGSIIINSFNLSISPSFNFVKQDQKKQIFKPITFEIGLMTKVENIYLSIYVDPIELEAKIGIGLGF